MVAGGMLQVLRIVPLDSTLIGPPRGFEPSAVAWAAKHGPAEGVLHTLEADADFRRTPPKTVDGRCPWQFERFYEGVNGRAIPGTVLEISHGRVFGTGTVIDAADVMIGDVSREMIKGNDQSQHSIFQRASLAPVRKVSGSVGVLAVVEAEVYWHWMIDLLPRLHLLQRYEREVGPVHHFVICPIRNGFQHETLDALGVDRNKLIEADRDQFHIRADTLLAPGITPQVPARWVCDFLHQELGSKLGPGTIDSAERLYVSRNDARNRRLLNEDAVMAELAPRGFQKVTLTGLSVTDQAKLFRDARVIITPHGSGLTNMVFANPGTVVIELFQPAYVNSCYWAIADFLGIDYYALIGKGKPVPPPPHGVDHRPWFFEHRKPDQVYGDDIEVEIEDLLALLRLAGVR
jgi:capsular polysaccharide biosynthesis protein